MITKRQIEKTLDTFESEIVTLSATRDKLDEDLQFPYALFFKSSVRYVDTIRQFLREYRPRAISFAPRKNPKPIKLSKKDRRILRGIYSYEGLLSLRQIRQLYYRHCKSSSSWPEHRIQALFDNRYLNLYDASNVNGHNLGEVLVTLAIKGAQEVANDLHATWSTFTWLKKPRWLHLAHDIVLNDFRFDVEQAATVSPKLTLHQWTSEFELRNVRPRILGRLDGFFILRRSVAGNPNLLEQLALHLEIDRGNHRPHKFIKQKVKPTIGYIGSSDYRKVFGVSAGTCLVVTTTAARLAKFKAATERLGGAGLFYFTTFDQVSVDSVLANPIWHLAGSKRLFSVEDLPLSPVDAGVLDDVAGARAELQGGLFN